MNEVKGRVLWLDRDIKPFMLYHVLRLRYEGYEIFEFGIRKMIQALECLIEKDNLDLIIVEPSFPLSVKEEEFFERLRSEYPEILPVPEHQHAKGSILIHAAAVIRPDVPVLVFSICSKGDISDIPRMLEGLERLSNVVEVSSKIDLADTAFFVQKVGQVIEGSRQKEKK